MKKPANTSYPWKFASVGGTVRVNIQSGEDIRHLGELDRKLWTVLSCPTSGLEFDETTLKLIDVDKDGKIRVDEVIKTAQWLTRILKNADDLLKENDSLPLDGFNADDPDGVRLQASARQILKNLQLEKDSISLEDTADNVKIFAQTQFNGDGIITIGHRPQRCAGHHGRACGGLLRRLCRLPGLDGRRNQGRIPLWRQDGGCPCRGERHQR